MSRRNKEFKISETRCVVCGNAGIPIPRVNGRYREKGHLKKLFCNTCQKETNHAEIRGFGKYTLEDFEEEFELGRFVNEKRVAVADLESCGLTECYYNRDGKCWNAIGDIMCRKRRTENE